MKNATWTHEKTLAVLYCLLQTLGRAEDHPSFWVELKSFVNILASDKKFCENFGPDEIILKLKSSVF